MSRPTLYIAFGILTILARTSYSLYEDQVGKFDWRQQLVGKPLYAEFDISERNGKRVVVGTEENVVAMINSKNGELLWRHIMEKGRSGEIDAMFQYKSYIIVVTGGGEFVRVFSASLGDLVWETANMLDDVRMPALAVVAGERSSRLAVMTSAGLSVYDVDSGELLVTGKHPGRDIIKHVALSAQQGRIVAVGIVPSSHIVVTKYTPGGVQDDVTHLNAAWVSTDTECVVLSNDGLVCLDTTQGVLYSASLTSQPIAASGSPGSGSPSFSATLLDKLGFTSSQQAHLKSLGSLAGTEFVLHIDQSQSAVLSLQSGSSLSVVRDLQQSTAVHLIEYNSQQTLLVLSRLQGDLAQLQGYDMLTGSPVSDLMLTVNLPSHHGRPSMLATTLFRKKDGTLNLRAIVASEDHSFLLFQQSGRVSWTREEALASILSVELVDLPVSNIMAKMEEEFDGAETDILTMFVKRFRSQLEQIQQAALNLRSILRTPRHHHHMVGEEEEEEEEDDEDYLTRDSFNMHKIIVATTAAGKIFGLDSPTGHIMWSTYVADLIPFDRFGVKSLPLAVQRTTSHPPNIAVCTVLGQHRRTGSGLLLSFNPISGVATDSTFCDGMQLGYNVQQINLLHSMNEQFLHPLIILDHQNQVHVFPESAKSDVVAQADSQYMFSINKADGLLHGFALAAHGDELSALPTWTINLHTDTQTITNVMIKSIHEHVHSQGIVLGDRSVLYKYLNPNLIVITAEGEDPTTKSFLNVYLLDVVSGSIVFHGNHKRAQGPVNVVHSENWVIYSYWNVKQRRSEVAVLELYEGIKQANATVFSSLNAPPAPLVMRQSYILPGHVVSMAVTQTERGITSKHVLFALETGAILELPKMLVDARRPLEPTQEHREEGLMPYIPELPRPYEMIINYNQSVYNIRKIHTSYAGLESTSLIFAYGLDLFYTKTTPSKPFDILKEDFDYFFIAMVVISMILVSIISQKLAAKKALSRAWK